MFRPQYRVTPYLLKSLESMAGTLMLVKQTRLDLPSLTGLEKETLSRNVHSSTWIEGNRLSLNQVKALAARQPVNAGNNQKREVDNGLTALRWVIAHRKEWVTQQKILKLHALMTAGLLPASRSGKYRTIQNFLLNERRQVIYTPPAPVKVKRRMTDLLTWMTDSRTSEHAVIRSAIFHHEFVAIHPFTDGNGRTARAAAQWLLFERGYSPIHTLGLDEFFAADRARYYNMIQQTHDMDGDYTHWVEYVAEGLLRALEQAAVRVKESARPHGARKIALTPKQEELVALLTSAGTMGSAEIGRQMAINRARVNQLIKPLVKAKIVIKQGATRGARYLLA